MPRRAWLLAILWCALVPGAQCEQRVRLAHTPHEEACRKLVSCWYPGDSGSQFSSASPRWQSMADLRTENNIRASYGPDGDCWYADPSAGQTIEEEDVATDAQAESCGTVCACAILELCAARSDVEDPAPECGTGVRNDPCDDPEETYIAMCEAS